MAELTSNEIRERVVELVKNLRERDEDPEIILGAIVSIGKYSERARDLKNKLVATKTSAGEMKLGKPAPLITNEMIEKRKQAKKEAKKFIDGFIDARGL